MDFEKIDHNRESAEVIDLTPPAVELLLDTEKITELWPTEIAQNESFVQQVEARKKLNDRLDIIISRLPRPDMSLQDAISEKHITEGEVADLYESLGNLLNDPEYKRAALYIPFEFLPNIAQGFSTEPLQTSAQKFKDIYMKAWSSLLHTHDVRANFLDGDVLEIESRTDDLPRVVKAAHLIPKLIVSGFMNLEDALLLSESSDDEVLKQSIAETLPVLADLNLIHNAELARIQSSPDAAIRNTAGSILASNNTVEPIHKLTPIVFEVFQSELRDQLTAIDKKKNDGASKRRDEWLKEKAKKYAIRTAGDKIAATILNNTLSVTTISEFTSPESDVASQQALVEGTKKAIEQAAQNDFESAKTLYSQHENTILLLWQRDLPEVRDSLSELFYHLHGLGIVTNKQLLTLGLTMPALSGPSSENLKLMEKEMLDVEEVFTAMKADAELMQHIYPTFLIYGSRLKGYGSQDADTDIGVMIKPDTPFEYREKIQQKLNTAFINKNIRGDIKEFWLEKTKDGLGVRNFENHDMALGEKSWTHVLFGAAWKGDKNAIHELREKLLVPYFYETTETLYEREARGIYLEELERDTLQYRLMHKGYEKFFPPRGGINTKHAHTIDGESTFWDSGYRMTAMKLFASRVFLPKIDLKK